MLNPGEQAPDFTLLDQNEQKHNLSDYMGRWVILYFYPKDNTPGCTKEACSFRDNWSILKQKAVVLGVSTDSVQSHQKFANSFDLPFSLLADTDKEVVSLYSVKSPLGTKRVTYVINPNGVIHKVYPKVKPEGHAKEILDDLTVSQT